MLIIENVISFQTNCKKKSVQNQTYVYVLSGSHSSIKRGALFVNRSHLKKKKNRYIPRKSKLLQQHT